MINRMYQIVTDSAALRGQVVARSRQTQQAGCSISESGSSISASETLAQDALQEQETNHRLLLVQGSPPVAAQQGHEAAGEAGATIVGGTMILYSWNVEGKKELAEIEDDISDWDVLFLQEVSPGFQVAPHVFVRTEVAYRSCAVVINRMLSSCVRSLSPEARFLHVTLSIEWLSCVSAFSAYIPHQRSVRGVWHDACSELFRELAQRASGGDRLMCGADLSIEKIVPTAAETAPTTEVSYASAKVECSG